MAGTAEAFNDVISEAGIRVRFMALQDRSYEEIEMACIECIRGRKYSSMPTVAEMLDFIGGGSVEDRAQVEAAKVWKAVIDFGGYRSVCFDDAVTQAVIVNGFGGWPKMCSELKVDEQKWFIKEFCQIYGAYSRQKLTHTGTLGGIGDNPKGVALIGDPEKVKAILGTPQIEQKFEADHVSSTVKKLTDNIGS
jgi:hypothetical protein